MRKQMNQDHLPLQNPGEDVDPNLNQGNATKNDDINKPLSKGRKRAAVSQESPGGLEAGNAKAPKLQDTAKKAAPTERQIDLQR